MQNATAQHVPLNVSKFLSRCFDMYIIYTFVIVVCVYQIQTYQAYIWGSIFILCLAVFPVIGDIFLLYKKVINDWDLSIRKERVEYMVLDTLLLAILLFAAEIGSAPHLLKVMLLIFVTLQTCFSFITFWWKISMHGQLVSLFIIFSCVFLGGIWYGSILFLPLVGFSRIYLKMHTLGQVIAGSGLTFVIGLIILKIFHYY